MAAFWGGGMPAAHMLLAELGQSTCHSCVPWGMAGELEAHFTAEEAEAQGNQEAVQGQIVTGWGWLAPEHDKPAMPRPQGKAEGFPAADESLGLDPAQTKVQQFPPLTERKRGVFRAP